MAKEKTEKKPKPAKKEKPPKKERPPKKPRKGKRGAALEETEELLEEQEGGKKLNPIFIIVPIAVFLVAVVVVVVFVLLPMFRARDAQEELPPEEEPVYYDLPEEYAVGEEIITAMDPAERNGVQATQSVRVSYTYTSLLDAGAETSGYVSNLVSEQGFSVVDDEYVRTDKPEFNTPEGRVLLAKNLPLPEPEPEPERPPVGEAPKGSKSEGIVRWDTRGNTPPPREDGEEADAQPEGMVLTVELVWTPGECVVTADQATGRVTSPPRGPGSTTPGAAMSMMDAVDYLYTLEPARLGLSGESMEEYNIYAMNGTAMVDGQPCLRLSIYSKNNPEHTNDVAGTYLMSRDGQRLYLLDEVKGTVTLLP